MEKNSLNKSGKFFLVFVLLLSFLGLRASVGPGIPVRPFLDNNQNKNSYAMAKAMAMAMAMATSDRVLSGEDASSPINIDAAGTYGLSENLTGTLIVISADDVTLDLGGHTITSQQSDSDMIIVEPGINRIKIKNGIIVNSVTTGTGNGILVQNGVSQVTIENIRTQGFNAGVKLDGEYGSEITKCQISGCEFVGNSTGIQLNYTNKGVIKNCTASENTELGFDLNNSGINCLFNCQSLETKGDASIIAGFKSDSGSGNLFQRCVAKRTETSSSFLHDKAYGFLLTGTEKNSKIIECIINETRVTEIGDGLSCGIALNGKILDSTSQVASDSTPTAAVRSVAWSPDGRYIATGDDDNYIRTFTFDGTQMGPINGQDTQYVVNSVDWSPDGRYLVSGIGTSPGLGYAEVYSFDGASISEKLNQVAFGQPVKCVQWSPDGENITLIYNGGIVAVYSFDGSTLTLVDSFNLGDANIQGNSVDWSPNGRYIVTSEDRSGGGIVYVRVFLFNGLTLTQVAQDEIGATSYFKSASWSPNGKYIVCDFADALLMFTFDGSDLTPLITEPLAGGMESISWSPDGKYIAVVANTVNALTIFSFDIFSFTSVFSSSALNAYSVSWSPDGRFIATGTVASEVTIWNAMNAPQYCFVDHCKVCDTIAVDLQLLGTGILGGGRNGIANNTCYNNNLNFTYGIYNVYRKDHPYFVETPFDNVFIYGYKSQVNSLEEDVGKH